MAYCCISVENSIKMLKQAELSIYYGKNTEILLRKFKNFKSKWLSFYVNISFSACIFLHGKCGDVHKDRPQSVSNRTSGRFSQKTIRTCKKMSTPLNINNNNRETRLLTSSGFLPLFSNSTRFSIPTFYSQSTRTPQNLYG